MATTERTEKLRTRLPSLSAMDRAAKVCAALAERERREDDIERAEVLERAGEICAAKAFVGIVVAQVRRQRRTT